ncbi:hypothetical protein MNQ41_004239 [Salmonella enterica]|nr:hypothetical protein [Salmonella enterica]EJK3463120.1 hypothetical protein [Salmonella enterica]ELT4646958.1 hypothetical protein [Salmonella enterica]
MCPSDAAGVKADFTNLTGDDIRALASSSITFQVHDVYAAQDMTSAFPSAYIAFYGELRTHKNATNLGTSDDLFHTDDAKAYCRSVVGRFPDQSDDPKQARTVALQVLNGTLTGGPSSADSELRTIQMGSITSGIHTGGDTNPELFVAGLSNVQFTGPDGMTTSRELMYDASSGKYQYGTKFPAALVLVNGSRRAATTWDWVYSAPYVQTYQGQTLSVDIGLDLHTDTGWNLEDAYYVNNWPGTPYTLHKGNGDTRYHYVTQVNYITGYICAASLH